MLADEATPVAEAVARRGRASGWQRPRRTTTRPTRRTCRRVDAAMDAHAVRPRHDRGRRRRLTVTRLPIADRGAVPPRHATPRSVRLTRVIRRGSGPELTGSANSAVDETLATRGRRPGTAFDASQGRPGHRAAGQGGGHGRAQRPRLRHLSRPRLRRRSGFPPGQPTIGPIEEVQHGDALGRWASWPIRAGISTPAFERYRTGYKLPLDADASVRGSRTGELIARCMVETGTSSYYTALGGRDRRAGAEAGLPADRRRRIPPFQAVLRPHAALSGAREARPVRPACASPPAASPRARTTSSPTPTIAATSRKGWPTSTSAASPATWAAR